MPDRPERAGVEEGQAREAVEDDGKVGRSRPERRSRQQEDADEGADMEESSADLLVEARDVEQQHARGKQPGRSWRMERAVARHIAMLRQDASRDEVLCAMVE